MQCNALPSDPQVSPECDGQSTRELTISIEIMTAYVRGVKLKQKLMAMFLHSTVESNLKGLKQVSQIYTQGP